MTKQPIRLLVVDDHGIVRKGICALLAQVADMQVVGEASDGESAVAQAEALKPDVILMDLVMPKMDGVEAIRQILDRLPQTRIIALTSFVADDKVFPAIKAGALGYLLKDSEPEDLLGTIRRVYAGEPSLPPSIAIKVLDELSHPKTHSLTPEPLTEREVEVLRLVAQGRDNREIAHYLGIGQATVRTHLDNILSKLHLANRVQATLYALRQGLTSLDETGKT
ncbi:MAG: response regulator transcription factor [Chloroflexi bacterium]|nr:response regulator transcription factor [Chloroflexota bacterium]